MYNQDFFIINEEDEMKDSTVTNFIKNTTKSYTREQLVTFFEDDEEIALYLNLIDSEEIKESQSSNVILGTTNENKSKGRA
jgi:hypothetical protein